ncbi:wntless, partial [Brachionus plicatilis]
MSGNGVILERLSGRKLSVLVATLFLAQILFFLLGALKFPHATHTETVEGIMCKDSNVFKRKKTEEFFYLRDFLGRPLSNCDRIEVDHHNNIILNTKQKEIVYAFQIPLPRDNQVLKLHRWFQTMSSILQLQVLFPLKLTNKLKNLDPNETAIEHSIPLDIRLAYRNTNDSDKTWHQMARSNIEKKFSCFKNPYSLDCDMVELFELGSVHHEFYAINIRLGESDIVQYMNFAESSKNLYLTSELPEVRLVLTFIYQTGGFTRMWFIMKTSVFPVVLFILIWFWNRIEKLNRKSNLLERILLALGTSICLLNLPVEWLTLIYDLKWMLLYTDLRQGIFYSTLFTFWLVFCGEHFVDENSMSSCPITGNVLVQLFNYYIPGIKKILYIQTISVGHKDL